MIIRLTTIDDIPILAEYWYDRMALLSQKTKVIRLMPDAQARWAEYVQALLGNNRAICFTAEFDGEVVACMLGIIEENQAGLLPENYGKISNIVLDLHSPQHQQGTVNALLARLKQHFHEQGLSEMLVDVPISASIEQAFWDGLGARHYRNTFWMTI
jgi:hypothetical protein